MNINIAKEQAESIAPEISELKEIEEGIINLRSTLKQKLFEKLKTYRDMDGQEFYIANKFATLSGLSLLKDTLYLYSSGIVLCERLFLGDKCVTQPLTIDTLSDEQKDEFNSFLEYTEKIPDTKDLSDEEAQEIMNEFNEKQKIVTEKLKKKDKKTYDIVVYNDEINMLTYPVIPLKEIDDESLMAMSSVISDFVASFYNYISYSNEYSEVSLVGYAENPDYVDIVAMAVN